MLEKKATPKVILIPDTRDMNEYKMDKKLSQQFVTASCLRYLLVYFHLNLTAYLLRSL